MYLWYISAVADFDPTSLNVTFPPSTIETTASISLPSIIPDTINEAVEGLVLQLEVVSVDEDGLTESSRHVALLLITDDDSKRAAMHEDFVASRTFVWGGGGVACEAPHFNPLV